MFYFANTFCVVEIVLNGNHIYFRPKLRKSLTRPATNFPRPSTILASSLWTLTATPLWLSWLKKSIRAPSVLWSGRVHRQKSRMLKFSCSKRATTPNAHFVCLPSPNWSKWWKIRKPRLVEICCIGKKDVFRFVFDHTHPEFQ